MQMKWKLTLTDRNDPEYSETMFYTSRDDADFWAGVYAPDWRTQVEAVIEEDEHVD
jgi:hypothetical protein